MIAHYGFTTREAADAFTAALWKLSRTWQTSIHTSEPVKLWIPTDGPMRSELVPLWRDGIDWRVRIDAEPEIIAALDSSIRKLRAQ